MFDFGVISGGTLKTFLATPQHLYSKLFFILCNNSNLTLSDSIDNYRITELELFLTFQVCFFINSHRIVFQLKCVTKL